MGLNIPPPGRAFLTCRTNSAPLRYGNSSISWMNTGAFANSGIDACDDRIVSRTRSHPLGSCNPKSPPSTLDICSKTACPSITACIATWRSLSPFSVRAESSGVY